MHACMHAHMTQQWLCHVRVTRSSVSDVRVICVITDFRITLLADADLQQMTAPTRPQHPEPPECIPRRRARRRPGRGPLALCGTHRWTPQTGLRLGRRLCHHAAMIAAGVARRDAQAEGDGVGGGASNTAPERRRRRRRTRSSLDGEYYFPSTRVFI